MTMASLYGGDPSLDDLSWRWEALQSGAQSRDALLCSLLPISRRPSVVFVETDAYNIYESTQNLNANVNDVSWCSTPPVTHHHGSSQFVAASVSPTVQQNAFSDIATVSVPNLDFSYDTYHYENFDLSDQSINMGLEYPNVGDTGELFIDPTIKAQTLVNGMTGDASYYDFSQSYSNVSKIDLKELERAQLTTNSIDSTSTSESFGEYLSQITEQSQEEIYEEIQRETAEIAHRSSLPRSPSLKTLNSQNTSPHTDDIERKKELNRIAAAKYREKKRIERKHKLTELAGLEERNSELTSQHDELQNEIKYLKDLIKEIHSRRNDA